MPRSKGSVGRMSSVEDVGSSGKQISKKIEKQLEKDKKLYQSTHRLLLLGAGESGKSTIAKQMQIMHVGGFSQRERENKREHVKQNVVDSLVSILRAMHTLRIEFEHTDNIDRSKYILSEALSSNFDFPEEFWDCARVLWQDRGVQNCYYRSSEYQLIDCAKHFLDKVDEIRKPTYLPDDQDILWCRVRTRGVNEIRFSYDKANFLMIDVGGQRDERKKWIQCFNDVTAIIFVCACSAFDQTLVEENRKNRLEESLELFRFIWNHKWLEHVSVILFLNKEDVLAQKVRSGVKIDQYFPQFTSYAASLKESSTIDQEIEQVKSFIKEMFMSIVRESSRERKKCQPYFTCAIDTENVRRVFTTCREFIRKEQLRQIGVLSD